MARKTAGATLDIGEQRETASGVSAYAEAIQDRYTAEYRDPSTGQTAKIGAMDPGKAPGRARDYQFEQRLSIIQRRWKFSKIPACTVINFLPVQLKVLSAMRELDVAIPPATRTEPFTFYTWYTPVVQIDQTDERTRTPTDFVPAQLGEEFLREYKEEGGVMVIEGTMADLDLEDPEVQKKIHAKQEEAFAWMGKKVREAWNYWNTPNHQQSGNITDVHRISAQVMYDNARLGNNLPAWMELTKSAEQISAVCPSCKGETKIGQAICINGGCSYVLDPRAAFEKAIIDEFDMRLERLTREELIEMGISDYVAESSDERPLRLKAGRPRPLSAFQLREQRALAEAQEAGRKAN